MRFTVVTCGSDGDTRPFATLSHGLQQAGHQVYFLGEQSSLHLASALGIEAEALAGDVRGTLPMRPPEEPLGVRAAIDLTRNLRDWVLRNAASWLDTVMARARNAARG